MSGHGIIRTFADKYEIDYGKLMNILKATAFRQRDAQPITDEQMVALLVVANQYGLNPFTKEIFAYPDKQIGIVPVVSVDGWVRIINEHPQLSGIEFRYSEETINNLLGMTHGCAAYMEVAVSRKDRSVSTVVREYLDEVYRPPFAGRGKDGKAYVKDGPWQSHTRRMLRHKTLIQGARLAFGFAGIYDEDEADRIIDRDITLEQSVIPSSVFKEPKTIENNPGETVHSNAHRETEAVDVETGEIKPPENQYEAWEKTSKPAEMPKQQEQKEQQICAPAKDSVKRIVRVKMEAAKLTEGDAKKKFGDSFSIDSLTMDKVNPVLSWIGNPNG